MPINLQTQNNQTQNYQTQIHQTHNHRSYHCRKDIITPPPWIEKLWACGKTANLLVFGSSAVFGSSFLGTAKLNCMANTPAKIVQRALPKMGLDTPLLHNICNTYQFTNLKIYKSVIFLTLPVKNSVKFLILQVDKSATTITAK